MSESLHPIGQNETNDVIPIGEEKDESFESTRSQSLRNFMLKCNSPDMTDGDQVADYVVATLREDLEGSLGSELSALKLDALSLGVDQLAVERQRDEILDTIFGLIIQTKNTVARNEKLSPVRRALFELLDLRAGVLAQFDQESLMNAEIENGWLNLLEKIVPSTSSDHG